MQQCGETSLHQEAESWSRSEKKGWEPLMKYSRPPSPTKSDWKRDTFPFFLQRGDTFHCVSTPLLCLSLSGAIYPPTEPPYPTSNSGMQNGSSVRIRTHCKHVFFAFLAPICMLSQCSLAKFLHRSSVGSLLRVHCWLGTTEAATPQDSLPSSLGESKAVRGGRINLLPTSHSPAKLGKKRRFLKGVSNPFRTVIYFNITSEVSNSFFGPPPTLRSTQRFPNPFWIIATHFKITARGFQPLFGPSRPTLASTSEVFNPFLDHFNLSPPLKSIPRLTNVGMGVGVEGEEQGTSCV